MFSRVPTVNQNGNRISASGGTDLNYFARLALVRDWEDWNARLVYRRSNSERARFGSSTIADTFTASLSFQASKFWRFNLVGNVSVQEQSVDQSIPLAFQLVNVAPPPGVTSVDEVAQVESVIASSQDNDTTYTTQVVTFRATRVLGPRSSAFASVSWNEQKQEFGGLERRWKNLTFWVGFQWNFEPIRF
jgi:hypothetical protein